MSYPSAARTNLTSDEVCIHSSKIGEGTFRVCLDGTFVGGNRNGQDAACKRFKPEHRHMQDEFFENDFKIVDRVVDVADMWNEWCIQGREIMVNKGTIHHSRSGIPYLVEPYIRDYTKFTSNNGWISASRNWKVRYMEAFAHYSYHVSGRQMIVCDLQGRYKKNRRDSSKSRFELTDPAICSLDHNYGPTDLGEKGIDSFFANHQCNDFCSGGWIRPLGTPRQWFPRSQGTSMMASTYSNQLRLSNPATFRMGLNNIMEEGSLSDYSDTY